MLVKRKSNTLKLLLCIEVKEKLDHKDVLTIIRNPTLYLW